VLRLFPGDIARGSKGFGFGWADPIDWHNWTDDGTAYVELHGGIAPTFWEKAYLGAGQAVEWTECWCPVSGIAQPQAATSEAVLSVQEKMDGTPRFVIGVHSTTARAAGQSALYVWNRSTCAELAHLELPAIEPGRPFTATVAAREHAMDDTAFVYLDDEWKLLAALNPRDCIPPVSSVMPLPSWVATEAFTVTWGGKDVWSHITAYDVQVRDGYEGNWNDWLTNTVATSATFVGVHGHTYFFRIRARDGSGNQEPYTSGEWGQAFTTVLTVPAPVLETSRKLASPSLLPPGRSVVYTVLISNTGNITADVSMTDTCPPGMVLINGTGSLPPGHTLVPSDSMVIRWHGTVAAGQEVRVSYTLSPATGMAPGALLTNTAEIYGGVRSPIIRRMAIRLAHLMWLPVVLRER